MSRIILVDDDEQLLAFLQQALVSDGHDVVTCDDGRTALEFAARLQPDLIVLDAMMPRVDGYQVLWHLRENDRTRDIPAMMLTSRSRHQDEQLGLSLGAQDYVFKPFVMEDVIMRIRDVLAGTPRRSVENAAAGLV